MFLPERTTPGRFRRIAVRAAAPLVLVAFAPAAVGATPAQSVATLTERAAKIAAELDRLDEQASIMDEKHNAARLELADLEAKLSDNEAAYTTAQDELGSTRDAAVSFVRLAYAGSTADDDPLRYLANPSSFDESARRAYLESTTGISADVAEGLAASQKVLSAHRTQLDAARAEVEKKNAELTQAQTDLEQLIEDRRELEASVKGELDAAVKAEQERRAAQEAERARAQAQAEAERAAAAARRASAATVSAPRPTTSSASSSSSASPSTPSVTPAAPPAPSVPAGGTAAGQAAVAEAMTQLRVPYKWAGSSPSTGFDCSGLVMWAYRNHRSLPHSSRALRSMTARISEAELVPGDLVFAGNPVHHVGIYIGNGQMVHSPRTGDVVKVSGVYQSSKPVSFGRL